MVLHELQHKEDEYRAAHPSWMDQEVAPRRSGRRQGLWPDVSMMGASNLRRVVGYDFHHIRKKYDVQACGAISAPSW